MNKSPSAASLASCCICDHVALLYVKFRKLLLAQGSNTVVQCRQNKKKQLCSRTCENVLGLRNLGDGIAQIWVLFSFFKLSL